MGRISAASPVRGISSDHLAIGSNDFDCSRIDRHEFTHSCFDKHHAALAFLAFDYFIVCWDHMVRLGL